MIRNKQLFLMMGAPGSGKSTWVKRQLNEYSDLYVSRDEIRFRRLKPGDDYFKYEPAVFQDFVETIVKGLLDKNTDRVFADASHLNAPSRAKLLKAIYAEFSYQEQTALFDVNVIWLKTTLKTCLERNALREGRANVPDATITSMWKSQTMPKAEEGIDRVYIINEKEKTIQIVELNSKDENNFIF